MKRILTIFILSLFLYNTIGFIAVHPIISIYFKYLGAQEANKPSKEEMIELLVFSKKDIAERRIDFKWIHSREFKYNGDMYDIVKKEETDKELIAYCINDTKEKKLEEEFKKRLHKNSSEDKNRSVSNNTVTISEPAQTIENILWIGFQTTFSCIQPAEYKSLIPDTPSPPPRLV